MLEGRGEGISRKVGMRRPVAAPFPHERMSGAFCRQEVVRRILRCVSWFCFVRKEGFEPVEGTVSDRMRALLAVFGGILADEVVS